MSTFGNIALAAVAVASLQALTTVAAEAKIKCDGPYQLTGGNTIRTPYCEDNYLASVAREYGMGVSGAEIRQSYNTKKRVCQVIRHDSRVSEICIGVVPDGPTIIWKP